jgi:hypothetical protein
MNRGNSLRWLTGNGLAERGPWRLAGMNLDVSVSTNPGLLA